MNNDSLTNELDGFLTVAKDDAEFVLFGTDRAVHDKRINAIEAALKFLHENQESAHEIINAFDNIIDNARRGSGSLECENVLESHWLNLRDIDPKEAADFEKNWNSVYIISRGDV